MRKTLFLIATLFTSFIVFAQGDNEEIIKPYLAGTELGAFVFKKSNTIKLSKEEFDFRAKYRVDFLQFVNQFANASDMEADFDKEDMSDSFIAIMYDEVFSVTEDGTSPEDIATSAGIASDKFNQIKTDGQRFIQGPKANPTGTCQLTIWTVAVGKEEVNLEFYLNESGQITEYEEIWPDF